MNQDETRELQKARAELHALRNDLQVAVTDRALLRRLLLRAKNLLELQDAVSILTGRQHQLLQDISTTLKVK